MSFDPLSLLAHGLVPLPWWGYVVVALVFTHITIASVTIYLHRSQAHRGLDLHPIASHFFRFWLWPPTAMGTTDWVATQPKPHATRAPAHRPACKPCPCRRSGRLGEQFVWHVPMGLWRPVLIEQVGHVVAEWLHCETRVEDGDLARLALRTRLRNLDGRIMTGELSIRVSPENFQGGPPLEMKRALRLAGHEVQDVAVKLALPHPRLWSPWSHGGPALYRAESDVTAVERRSAPPTDTGGTRDVPLHPTPPAPPGHSSSRRTWLPIVPLPVQQPVSPLSQPARATEDSISPLRAAG